MSHAPTTSAHRSWGVIARARSVSRRTDSSFETTHFGSSGCAGMGDSLHERRGERGEPAALPAGFERRVRPAEEARQRSSSTFAYTASTEAEGRRRQLDRLARAVPGLAPTTGAAPDDGQGGSSPSNHVRQRSYWLA